MNQYALIESNLSKLLPILHGYISKDYENELTEYLSYREYGIVYEDICDMIAWFKISISKKTYETIAHLGQLMEYDEKHWSRLNEFIKTTNNPDTPKE